MTAREKEKQGLRRTIKRNLAECGQAIRDAQWWAANRTEHPPLDAEWFMVQAAGLRKCLAALKNDERIDTSWLRTK